MEWIKISEKLPEFNKRIVLGRFASQYPPYFSAGELIEIKETPAGKKPIFIPHNWQGSEYWTHWGDPGQPNY